MEYIGNLSPFCIQFESEQFIFQILLLLLTKLKNFYYTFPGYLASVDSYMNLQVLIWQFGCHTIRVVVYRILFRWTANHQLGTKWHTKFIAAFFFLLCAACQHWGVHWWAILWKPGRDSNQV